MASSATVYNIGKQAIITLESGTLAPGTGKLYNVTNNYTNNGFINVTYEKGFKMTNTSYIQLLATTPVSQGGSGRIYDMS